MKCIHCGDEQNVTIKNIRVCDDLWIKEPMCVDEVACWARWDKQNGIKNSYAQELLKRRPVNA